MILGTIIIAILMYIAGRIHTGIINVEIARKIYEAGWKACQKNIIELLEKDDRDQKEDSTETT